jgi:hypothetical protein
MLLFVSIFDMTTPAQSHQIFDFIFILAATHTPAINMMNVNHSSTTDFATHKIIFDITKKINWECQSRLKRNVELLENHHFRTECLTIIDQHSGQVQQKLKQMVGLTKYK